MIENLHICNILKPAGATAGLPAAGFSATGFSAHDLSQQGIFDQDDWILFETCQRRVFISINSAFVNPLGLMDRRGAANSPDNVLSGEQAYAKLLKILCGLESKILAETEVFGQFKIFAAALPANSRFKRLAQDLILDVRDLRKSCLGGIGLRSYGSLSQFYVAGLKSVALIGGGQLAQKILPYLNEANQRVSIYLRQPAKAALLPQRLTKGAKIYSLYEDAIIHPPQGVIIAAPISTRAIENWLKTAFIKPEIIVDLRDQSVDQRLDFAKKLVTLDDLFLEIEETSQILLTKVERAENQVVQLTKQRLGARYFRPFGWEDICA